MKIIQCFCSCLLSRVNFALIFRLLAKLSGWSAGDPVDVVRQQDQHDPPGRLRRAHQVGGGAGTRLLAFLPSPHSQHFSLNLNNSMGNGTFPASSLNLDRQLQWKSFKPYPALCESRPTQCFPHALTVPLFSGCSTAANFLDFPPAQNFLPQFLTVTGSSGSPQGPDFQNF